MATYLREIDYASPYVNQRVKLAMSGIIGAGRKILNAKGKPAYVFVEEFLVDLANVLRSAEDGGVDRPLDVSVDFADIPETNLREPVLVARIPGYRDNKSVETFVMRLSADDIVDDCRRYFKGVALPFPFAMYRNLVREEESADADKGSSDTNTVLSLSTAMGAMRNFLCGRPNSNAVSDHISETIAMRVAETAAGERGLIPHAQRPGTIDVSTDNSELVSAITYSVLAYGFFTGKRVIFLKSYTKTGSLPAKTSERHSVTRLLRDFDYALDGRHTHLTYKGWTFVDRQCVESADVTVYYDCALGGLIDGSCMGPKEAAKLDARYRSDAVPEFVSESYKRIAEMAKENYKKLANSVD